MDTKRFLLAAVAVFVFYSGLAFLIHEVILGPEYEPMVGSLLRSVEEFSQRMLFLYLGNLVFALAFCLIYAKGYEPGKGWIGQGLRYGLIVGTLLAPFAVTEYVVYPVAGTLALKWIVFGYLQILISALVAAGIYQPQS
ncbi:MAG: hypothetical protein HY656_02100 [Acidobacteria bacterium]|nr:hypothetical protein [Acidobacteriota bacterium]